MEQTAAEASCPAHHRTLSGLPPTLAACAEGGSLNRESASAPPLPPASRSLLSAPSTAANDTRNLDSNLMPGPWGRGEAQASQAGGLRRGCSVIGCGRGWSISSPATADEPPSLAPWHTHPPPSQAEQEACWRWGARGGGGCRGWVGPF